MFYDPYRCMRENLCDATFMIMMNVCDHFELSLCVRGTTLDKTKQEDLKRG